MSESTTSKIVIPAVTGTVLLLCAVGVWVWISRSLATEPHAAEGNVGGLARLFAVFPGGVGVVRLWQAYKAWDCRDLKTDTNAK